MIIATGNHWHALATIWACQAGKDVYVEKPVSHSIWEGCKMLEAEQKYGRIIQVGTQFRSDSGLPEAVEFIRSGALGRIQYIHALYYKERPHIGRRKPWYPSELDYDLFCGPAPMTPLERNELHYDWHWNWATGNGELGNLGVHSVDIARRFIDSSEQPRRVISIGGRHVHADAAETPNTQLTLLHYPDVPLFFESRGLPAKPGVRYMDNQRGIRQGVIVQCDNGYFAGFYGGTVYDNSGAKIRAFPGDGGGGHMANFIAAVRSRRRQDLVAPLTEGHRSTSACLLGNISYRIGRPAPFAAIRDELASMPPAQAALDDIGRHLAVHGVDLQQQPLTAGRWLQIGKSATVASVESGTEDELSRARFLTQEVQRPPYIIPDQI